ncbi:hypothetical protein V1514DRAFT_350340 [Lipomyces japonicus]|uniref:uncharacterized protein n=1 Tax=Lipomyces japonicus TaxID=56871 RepID=UPI0034CE86AB
MSPVSRSTTAWAGISLLFIPSIIFTAFVTTILAGACLCFFATKMYLTWMARTLAANQAQSRALVLAQAQAKTTMSSSSSSSSSSAWCPTVALRAQAQRVGARIWNNTCPFVRNWWHNHASRRHVHHNSVMIDSPPPSYTESELIASKHGRRRGPAAAEVKQSKPPHSS